MLLDATTAEALASIVMMSTQGVEALNPQLPWDVVDRGDNWLVKGTPYTDKKRGLQYCMCHLFFRKISAEVTGIGCDGRQILTEKEKTYWSNFMKQEDYNRIFGPRTRFEPDGIMDYIYALYGGLINKSADAVDYAYVLMRTKPGLAIIPKSELYATEQNKVWHVTAKMAGHADGVEVLSFSRNDGKVLSGNL